MSAPGAAAGAAGAGGDGGGVQGDGDAQQQNDFAALAGQLDRNVRGQETVRDFMQSLSWQQPDGSVGSYGGEYGSPDLQALAAQLDGNQALSGELEGLDVTDPQAVGEHFADLQHQAAVEAAQEAMAPLADRMDQQQQQLDEARREQYARDLVSEFPEMGDREIATTILNTASQYAQTYGWPVEVANHPAFWRLTYMANQAAQHAQDEGSPDAGSAAHLEGGGGGVPGSNSQRGDLFDQVLGYRGKQGSAALPFNQGSVR